MSYPGLTSIQGVYTALSGNPLDIIQDPEFRALNPNTMDFINGYDTSGASTLFSISSDSDLMTALTSYINADPEARAWLDGRPDPWGMIVNPNYKKVALPVNSWPILDTFKSDTFGANNPCLATNPVPLLPLIAAPVSNPATVTLNMQYQIANSQLICQNAGALNQKLSAVGRQVNGRRAMFGLVSLADAVRYKIPSASLQTFVDSSAASRFSDASGRYFASPSDDSLRAAAALLKPDNELHTWPIPYASLRTSVGAAAYPGSVLMTLDVPTSGLSKTDAADYAALLDYIVTKGQVRGADNGQLPEGYLPLTDANGLAVLAKFSKSSVEAIRNQSGELPNMDGSLPTAAPTPSASPTPTPTSTSSPTPIPTPTYSQSQVPSEVPVTGSQEPTSAPSQSPSAAVSGQPTAVPTPSPSISLVSAATPTTPIGSIGRLLPLLGLVALVAGVGAVAIGVRSR